MRFSRDPSLTPDEEKITLYSRDLCQQLGVPELNPQNVSWSPWSLILVLSDSVRLPRRMMGRLTPEEWKPLNRFLHNSPRFGGRRTAQEVQRQETGIDPFPSSNARALFTLRWSYSPIFQSEWTCLQIRATARRLGSVVGLCFTDDEAVPVRDHKRSTVPGRPRSC